MPKARKGARRGGRLHYPVPLVDGPEPIFPLNDEEAHAYASGLRASLWIKELFREFWDEHVAPRQVHAGSLAGAMVTFYQLVSAECEFYYWDGIPYDVERNLETPEEHMAWCSAQHGHGAESLLGSAAEWLGEFVRTPPIMFYGIGINDYLDGEAQESPSLLTLTIWHLFSRSGASLGKQIQQMFQLGLGEDHADIERIQRLKPLPDDTNVLELFRYVHLAGFSIPDGKGFSHGDLLAYALGETNNPLANATNYDLEQIYNNDSGYTWWEFEDFAALSTEAEALASTYQSLEAQCKTFNACVRLVREIRRAAAAARRETKQTSPLPLVETLGGLDEDDYAPVEVEQW